MFHNIFDTVPERPVGNTENLYFILNGGSLSHRVVRPKQETFATDDADVKTAIETYEKIKKQVVVIGQDVDLLVLPTALTRDYMDILMLKEGNDKIKDRFYSSKDLGNSNLVAECKNSIIFLPAISGCDTTSGFYGKGELQAVQLFNHSKYFQDTLRSLITLNQLILRLKDQHEESCLNKMRYDCFNKLVGEASSAILFSKLPPTIEAVHQRTSHIPPRANMARTVFEPIRLGMEVVNMSLIPIYTTKGPAPAKIVFLITCGCNKGCGKNANVSELTCVVLLCARTVEAKASLIPK
ncbi:hypothetical protein AVEN_110714-1 [Araneus ventricosus]|uniref:Uncharacterized protein n=1 Tax=Araneus ventricosus TaxID=182803 RepID=A0A4Y2AW74_ARAVE|nr:hypothetical protein AVEN_110714-1 [Araneus ventricosus]